MRVYVCQDTELFRSKRLGRRHYCSIDLRQWLPTRWAESQAGKLWVFHVNQIICFLLFLSLSLFFFFFFFLIRWTQLHEQALLLWWERQGATFGSVPSGGRFQPQYLSCISLPPIPLLKPDEYFFCFPWQIPAGGIVDEIVLNVDLAPTFLDYADASDLVESGWTMQGGSLSAELHFSTNIRTSRAC